MTPEIFSSLPASHWAPATERFRRSIWPYAVALLLMGVALVLSAFVPFPAPESAVLLAALAVVIGASYGGLGPGLAAAMLAVFARRRWQEAASLSDVAAALIEAAVLSVLAVVSGHLVMERRRAFALLKRARRRR